MYKMIREYYQRGLSIAILAILAMTSAAVSQAASFNLEHASRAEEEKARDINRKPIETLAFFEVEHDMRVVELFPGRGWYTKLLAPYLEDKGQLYVAFFTERLGGLLDQPGFEKVEIVGEVENFTKTDLPGFIFSAGSIDLKVKNIDRILTFRNAHNLTAEARGLLNRAAFDALKPGGIYGVIDHTKRHMEPFSAETWRRVDPVLIVKEALDAGFIFEGYSDLHRRDGDNLKHDSRHESLVNESDRFTLKFRKPK